MMKSTQAAWHVSVSAALHQFAKQVGCEAKWIDDADVRHVGSGQIVECFLGIAQAT